MRLPCVSQKCTFEIFGVGFRPHRCKQQLVAAYCYGRSSVCCVSLSVCLSVCLSVGHVREPCKNGWTNRESHVVRSDSRPIIDHAITDHVNTENHIIDWEEAAVIGRESDRTTCTVDQRGCQNPAGSPRRHGQRRGGLPALPCLRRLKLTTLRCYNCSDSLSESSQFEKGDSCCRNVTNF